jgi:hypothetical protein
MIVARPALALGLVLWGCGGKAASADSAEEQPAGQKPAGETLADLRFTKIVAGFERYCGLTYHKALACIGNREGELKLEFELAGPFEDFAFHEDVSAFWELCTLAKGGKLDCLNFPEVPPGEYKQVAIGFFNPCALDTEGRVHCWFDDGIGGSRAPSVVGASQLAVEMDHACVRYPDNPFLVECFGQDSDDSLADLHFLNFAVANKAVCGMVLSIDGAHGVYCVDGAGAKQLLSGTFSSVDVDISASGCATDDQGYVHCWGRREVLPNARFHSLSVSGSQVCALDEQDAAQCFRPAE